MESWLIFLKNIPLHVNPIAFKLGFFSIGWYALMYVVAFLVVYYLLLFRIKKGESFQGMNKEVLMDFLIIAVLGVLLGGRLGYVFYDFGYFFQNPILIFSPYDFSEGVWVGIYGMSFHGGLLGVLFSSWLFIKKKKIKFWKLADFVVPAIPAGYFFGRLGNFLNLELYGKETGFFLGMNFGDGLWRHPTQIYEASAEGLLLFFLLWFLRNKSFLRGKFIFIYLIGYSFFRINIDFLRETDGIYEYAGLFSVSQFFSLVMLFFGILGLLLKICHKNGRILK